MPTKKLNDRTCAYTKIQSFFRRKPNRIIFDDTDGYFSILSSAWPLILINLEKLRIFLLSSLHFFNQENFNVQNLTLQKKRHPPQTSSGINMSRYRQRVDLQNDRWIIEFIFIWIRPDVNNVSKNIMMLFIALTSKSQCTSMSYLLQ